MREAGALQGSEAAGTRHGVWDRLESDLRRGRRRSTRPTGQEVASMISLAPTGDRADSPELRPVPPSDLARAPRRRAADGGWRRDARRGPGGSRRRPSYGLRTWRPRSCSAGRASRSRSGADRRVPDEVHDQVQTSAPSRPRARACCRSGSGRSRPSTRSRRWRRPTSSRRPWPIRRSAPASRSSRRSRTRSRRSRGCRRGSAASSSAWAAASRPGPRKPRTTSPRSSRSPAERGPGTSRRPPARRQATSGRASSGTTTRGAGWRRR